MNFWDSSAITPLLIPEKSTPRMLEIRDESETLLVWTLTPVEVVSALCRAFHQNRISGEELEKALGVWAEFKNTLTLIRGVEAVKERAVRLLRVHPLRAADSLQLAAALTACGEDPADQNFVTLDTKLGEAAAKEGFKVEPSDKPV